MFVVGVSVAASLIFGLFCGMTSRDDLASRVFGLSCGMARRKQVRKRRD